MKANKELRGNYLVSNPEDEMEPLLAGKVWEEVRDAWGYRVPPLGSEVVHHIYSGATGGRYDIVSLLVTVSPASHQYMHTEPKHGVIACMNRKLKKREWNFAEVKEAVGKDLTALVKIWIDNEEVTDPHYVDLAQELLTIARWRR